MSGEVTDPDDGLGPGLMVGSPQSASDGALLVSSFSDPFWSLQRSDVFLTETGVFPCTTLPFDDANAGRCADGTAPSTPSAPTDSVVESTVAELMETIGVGNDSYRTETFPDLVDVPVRTGPPLTVLAPLPASAVVPQPTLPVPPGPDTAAQDIPAFYDQVLDELLVGQPLDGAWARPLDAGWEVRIDDLDDCSESFDADLRSDRVTIEHRGITVVAVTVG